MEEPARIAAGEHNPFGLMERRRGERRNLQLAKALTIMTGRNFPDEMSEEDLVRSGLDDIMRSAYDRMAATLKANPGIRDFRTAAYRLALNQIAEAYKGHRDLMMDGAGDRPCAGYSPPAGSSVPRREVSW